jgi:hypothetical protein
MGLVQQQSLIEEIIATSPALRVLPAPAAAPAPAKPRGLNLGALTATPAAKKAGKNYPVATLDDDQRALVTQLLGEKATMKALEGSVDSLTAELLAITTPQYLAAVTGQGDALTSLVAPGTDGREAIIVHTSRYKTGAQMDAVVSIVGADRAAEFFTDATTIKIDFEKIPEANRQAVVDGLLAVAAEYGCAEAIDAKVSVQPKAHFHGLRHSKFTVAENLALQGAIPMVCQVKARS